MTLGHDEFMRHYYAFVYVRIMQALGAYGFRGFYERKPHFLQSVPFALKNLRWLLANVELPVALPTLLGAFESMIASETLRQLTTKADVSRTKEALAAPPLHDAVPDAAKTVAKGHLELRIFSFSYHQSAPPKDESGHGGGFVFDARGLPNPGREERFKTLTGQDAPVREYLEQQSSVREFLSGATALVESSVKNYQERGFKNLMVSFGCTGGQHRSVYLAEAMAKHFRNHRGVNVTVRHIEMEKLAK